MTATQGNRTTQAFGIEPSANTEPTGSTFYLSPNSIASWGPEVERLTRDPLGPNIMPEAGTVIRTMAKAAFDGDFIRDHFRAFTDGLLRCAWSTTPRRYYPTSVRSTDFVVSANGALAEGTLIIVRGCAKAANNGLKVVGAGSDATHIVASGLTAETFSSGQGVTVEVCGFQFTTGDAQIDADGNLIATTADLTTLGLTVGQKVWIGGATTATKFATASDRGEARVSVIAAGKLTLENKVSGTLATADNGSGKTIQIFFGQMLKVSPTTAAAYQEPTYQVEVGLATIDSGSPMYEYVTGCAAASGRLSFPTSAKATMALTFEGQGTVDPTGTRRTAFAAPLAQNARALMNTGSHVVRGTLSSSAGAALTGVITSVDLAVDNAVQVNYGHGQNAPVLTTMGDCAVNVTVGAFFEKYGIVVAMQADDTCSATWTMRCAGDAWGVGFDLPAVQIMSAPKSVSATAPVSLAIGLRSVRDPIYNTTLIVSDFPYLPAP